MCGVCDKLPVVSYQDRIVKVLSYFNTPLRVSRHDNIPADLSPLRPGYDTVCQDPLNNFSCNATSHSFLLLALIIHNFCGLCRGKDIFLQSIKTTAGRTSIRILRYRHPLHLPGRPAQFREAEYPCQHALLRLAHARHSEILPAIWIRFNDEMLIVCVTVCKKLLLTMYQFLAGSVRSSDMSMRLIFS